MSKLKKALDKAKETRKFKDTTFIPKVVKTSRQTLQHADKKESERCEVCIDYSATKLLQVDHGILKKNKIISLFKEYEITDQFNLLRTQVLNKLKKINGNSLLVTSANPFEGKTFTAINLAISIVQELDRTVLLVDADLRHPMNHHCDFANDFFGIRTSSGLAHYLLAKVEIPDLLLNPSINKLTILPSGRPLSNSAELLGSPRMELLIKEMKDRYRSDRIIIFDSPAILKCTDPLVLSFYTDAVILVAEEEMQGPARRS